MFFKGSGFVGITIKQLYVIAANIRKKILKTAYYKKQGHVGGSLSATDLLTVLFFDQLNIDENNLKWADRDRFVLSKGHVALGLYATFAERGLIQEDELNTFDQLDSRLQAHPDMTRLDVLDMSTGSLGQGVSTAVGMALGAKLQQKDFQVYALVGDGESQEGQVWEAAFVASRYMLDNLIVIVDQNELQQYGWGVGADRNAPDLALSSKFESFGFDVQQINGHKIEEIQRAFTSAKRNKNGKPKAIIAATVKGKGVSFMESNYLWHSKAPNDAEFALALQQLDDGSASLCRV